MSQKGGHLRALLMATQYAWLFAEHLCSWSRQCPRPPCARAAGFTAALPDTDVLIIHVASGRGRWISSVAAPSRCPAQLTPDILQTFLCSCKRLCCQLPPTDSDLLFSSYYIRRRQMETQSVSALSRLSAQLIQGMPLSFLCWHRRLHRCASALPALWPGISQLRRCRHPMLTTTCGRLCHGNHWAELVRAGPIAEATAISRQHQAQQYVSHNGMSAYATTMRS